MTVYKDNPQAIIGLVILHNDLRIHDNATLAKASAVCDRLLIVYCKQPLFKPTLNRGQPYHIESLGRSKQLFLQQSLQNLDNNLHKRGNRLLCLDTSSHFGKQHQPIFNQLETLIQDYKVSHIFVSDTADYNQRQGYRLLRNHVPNTQWHYSVTASLFDTMPIDKLPNSFTAFRKHIEQNNYLLTKTNEFLITPSPATLTPPPLMSNSDIATYGLTASKAPEPESKTESKTKAQDSISDTPFNVNPVVSTPFVGGEDEALAHLEAYFDSDAPQTYKQTRNTLDLTDKWSHTTRFSPWLANGSLSVRVLLNRLRQYQHNVVANDSTYWIWFELLWREFFYWYAATHGKKLFTLNGITGNKKRSCFYGERFERWKNGNTPYPIVNACMNQLKATGYMSNRGRQLVASCLIHELGLDWRYGATYFESQLIDYDVASNWGNWQYLAGVGADPRGSRRFNLDKQTATYDPDGTFIKKWQGDSGATLIDSVDAADWYV